MSRISILIISDDDNEFTLDKTYHGVPIMCDKIWTYSMLKKMDTDVAREIQSSIKELPSLFVIDDIEIKVYSNDSIFTKYPLLSPEYADDVDNRYLFYYKDQPNIFYTPHYIQDHNGEYIGVSY